ncbi:MAG: pilus assembly protein PilM [Candidatus Omnitrophica bacterium]|nr:pilus assembly protein PilM [Candidatus Omnitrophota bacterium]
MRSNLTTIEITNEFIKLVRSKRERNRPVVTLCEVFPNQNYEDQKIIQVIGSVLRKKNLQNDTLLILVPRRLVIQKVLNLPSQKREELRKMIAIQLMGLIPYDLDHVTFDFNILSKRQEGYARVCVYVVHNDVIKMYAQILKNAGAKESIISVTPHSLKAIYIFLRHKIPQIPQRVMLINVGLSFTELSFFDGEEFNFSRNIQYGMRDFTDEYMPDIIKQLSLSTAYDEKTHPGEPVEHIVLFIDHPQMDIFQRRIEHDLGVPVTVIQTPGLMREIAGDHFPALDGISYINVTGIHFSESEDIIDLTPQEIHLSRKSAHLKKQLILSAALCVCLMAFIGTLFSAKYFQKKEALALTMEQAKTINRQSEEARTKIEFVRFFYHFEGNKVFVPDIILEIVSLAPPDISFNSITLDDRGAFSLQGYAQSSSSVNNLQEGLVQSEYFDEVNLRFATKRRISRMELTDFKFTMRLKNIDESLEDDEET